MTVGRPITDCNESEVHSNDQFGANSLQCRMVQLAGENVSASVLEQLHWTDVCFKTV